MGDVPAHDWRALAASGGTIAAYMASKDFRQCRGQPDRGRAAGVDAGRGGGKCVAARTRRHVLGTLATLADLLEAERPDGPTLVLIGAVVAMSRAPAEEALQAA